MKKKKEANREDWYRIKDGDDGIIVEWSPRTGKNIRAKKTEKLNWCYGQVKQAGNAITVALDLIKQNKKNK